MKIAVIAPSIYMSDVVYRDRIFAPRLTTKNLVEGLVKKGHDVTLFSTPDMHTSAHLIPGSIDLLGGNLLRDKYLDREPHFEYQLQSAIELQHLYSLDLIGRAFQQIVKGEFDIVQTDDPLVHSFTDLVSTPVVYTLHDALPRKESLDYWFLNRYKDHNFVSISLSQRHGEPSLNFVENVYHGIRVEDYQVVEKPRNYFVFIGRLLEKKGLDDAISAVEKTQSQLLIASDKTHFNTQFVKDKILPHINGNTIRFYEYMATETEKSIFFSGAKALFFPIHWEEPFGLVMIEAMSCGTPVIAYNRGSVPEVIKDGITGFIIDQDDANRPGKGTWLIKKQGVEGLIEAMGRISEIDRNNCRKHVEENFTIDKMVNGYEALYEKLAKH